MGRLSAFESRMDRIMDGAAGAVFKAPINPVQITKRAEKEMFKEKLVSSGKQYAPTLYNVLVNPDDDAKLSGFYPTLAGEIETYLKGRAGENGLFMDGSPLVRFIVDSGLRKGKFDVIAENVAAQIIVQLREEEMERYGLAAAPQGRAANRAAVSRQEMPYQDDPRPNDGYHDEPYRDAGYSDVDYRDDDYRDDGYRSEGRRRASAVNPYEDPFAEPLAPAYEQSMPSYAQDDVAGYDSRPRVDEAASYDGYGHAERDAYRAPAIVPESKVIPLAGAMGGAAAAVGVGAGARGRREQPRQDYDAYRQAPTTRAFKQNPDVLFNPETGAVFELRGTRMVLGRDKNCDIAIRDSNVSRSHAELVLDGSTWMIRDLGSTNGTFVQGREISRASLRDGDMVTVGITSLEFQKG